MQPVQQISKHKWYNLGVNNLPALTADLIILLIIVIAVMYGLLLGHSKLKTFALSVYVGLVLAQNFGKGLYELLQSSNFTLGGILTDNAVALIVFGLPLLLLELGRKDHRRARARGGMTMTLILCILTAALVISSGISVMNPDAIKSTLDNSTLAWQIYTFRHWWLALVPIAIIGENFIKPKDSH